MPILLQGPNCKSAVQSGFMCVLLFIAEQILQTHEAPCGAIILVFSLADYATLPRFMNVAKVLHATDCTLSASTPRFAVLTLTGRHVGRMALQHLYDLSSLDGVCPHPPEKTNKYDRNKKVILSRKHEGLACCCNEILEVKTKGLS